MSVQANRWIGGAPVRMPQAPVESRKVVSRYHGYVLELLGLFGGRPVRGERGYPLRERGNETAEQSRGIGGLPLYSTGGVFSASFGRKCDAYCSRWRTTAPFDLADEIWSLLRLG